jgi:hypothetical protein
MCSLGWKNPKNLGILRLKISKDAFLKKACIFKQLKYYDFIYQKNNSFYEFGSSNLITAINKDLITNILLLKHFI